MRTQEIDITEYYQHRDMYAINVCDLVIKVIQNASFDKIKLVGETDTIVLTSEKLLSNCKGDYLMSLSYELLKMIGLLVKIEIISADDIKQMLDEEFLIEVLKSKDSLRFRSSASAYLSRTPGPLNHMKNIKTTS